jgi:hypothetical protein
VRLIKIPPLKQLVAGLRRRLTETSSSFFWPWSLGNGKYSRDRPANIVALGFSTG